MLSSYGVLVNRPFGTRLCGPSCGTPAMAVAPLHESNRAKVTAAQLRQLPRVVTPAVKCRTDVRVWGQARHDADNA
jgi:hypothetical protein